MGRRRSPLMQPGRYTELFFLDEATALAAGHRPCAECRREDYVRFLERWTERHPRERTADAIDLRLHAERFDPVTRRRRFHDVDARLGAGRRVRAPGRRAVRRGGSSLLLWTPRGYASRVPRPTVGRGVSITPPSLVAHLRDGGAPRSRSCIPPRPASRRSGRLHSPARPRLWYQSGRGDGGGYGLHRLADRAFGSRQDDDRARPRGGARAARRARRGARRRRRAHASLEGPRLLARGPRHEHRADRLGRLPVDASRGRCRGRGDLALRRDAKGASGRSSRNRGRSSRSGSRRRSKSARAGTSRASTRRRSRARSRISPASTTRTRTPTTPRSWRTRSRSRRRSPSPSCSPSSSGSASSPRRRPRRALRAGSRARRAVLPASRSTSASCSAVRSRRQRPAERS